LSGSLQGKFHKIPFPQYATAVSQKNLSVSDNFASCLIPCIGTNLELVKSPGTDEVIDFIEEDFTNREELYDFIFDAFGRRKSSKKYSEKTVYDATFLFLKPSYKPPDILQPFFDD